MLCAVLVVLDDDENELVDVLDVVDEVEELEVD